MGNIKVGDKVRFLNTTGGGVVRGFQGKDQVLVEDEDGFEVPALIRECVVVGEGPQVHSSNKPKSNAAEMEKQITSTRQLDPTLEPGQWRYLTETEIHALLSWADGENHME